jgi:preprotein translocase subunit SecD
MKFRVRQFNAYLLLTLLVGGLIGCSTGGSHKKQLSSLRIFLEANTDDPASTDAAKIGRSSPVTVHVEKEPFLTEAHVKEAKVLDTEGGFVLQIKFGKIGGQLLEQYTTANRGKRFAVYSRFFVPGLNRLNDGRWLAAPKILKHMGDGLFTFTPDATRDEAIAIARGLTDIGRKLDPEPKW